jgi:hypothetical protein
VAMNTARCWPSVTACWMRDCCCRNVAKTLLKSTQSTLRVWQQQRGHSDVASKLACSPYAANSRTVQKLDQRYILWDRPRLLKEVSTTCHC